MSWIKKLKNICSFNISPFRTVGGSFYMDLNTVQEWSTSTIPSRSALVEECWKSKTIVMLVDILILFQICVVLVAIFRTVRFAAVTTACLEEKGEEDSDHFYVKIDETI